MSLLAETLEVLSKHELSCAAIGAAAMAAHGVARSTMDIDLLLVGRHCLDSPAWDSLRRGGVSVDVRRGDADDPLAGVVRVRRADALPIDVVVGSFAWQQRVIDRAAPVEIHGALVPVAAVRDLILLKLYAGSPQDRWDVERLLETSSDPALAREVESEVDALPHESRELWRSISSARRK